MSQQISLEQFENYETKIKLLSQNDLIFTAQDLFIKEKKISDALLVVLGEIHFRRSYAELGFASLFEMLVKYFKLSESSAYQKIGLCKLIKEVPAAKEALLNGSVSSSNLVLAQAFIKEQNKSAEKELTVKEKTKLIEDIKDKSHKETKEHLANLNPQFGLPKDKIKPINESQSNIQCTIDKVLQEKLEKIKNLIAHKNPNPTMNELLHLMADISLEQIEKKKLGKNHIQSEARPGPHTYRKVCVTKPKNQTDLSSNIETIGNNKTLAKDANAAGKTKICSEPKAKRSRYISKKVKREVYQRARGQCQFISSSGYRCQCKKFLQFEHIISFAKGGLNDSESLQLFCWEHNALKAKKDFGKDPRDYSKTGAMPQN